MAAIAIWAVAKIVVNTGPFRAIAERFERLDKTPINALRQRIATRYQFSGTAKDSIPTKSLRGITRVTGNKVAKPTRNIIRTLAFTSKASSNTYFTETPYKA